MSQRTLRVQWIQLIALSGVHFLVDMFGNVLPAVLPVICREFAVTLALGGFILASLPLASNGIQILTGHLRPDKTRPLFLHLGMVLAVGVCLMALAPRSTGGIVLLVGLGVVSGCGIAIAHPEGLRALHTIDRIPSSLGTAVFMTTGFLGFASGGAISAGLVAAYGLKGLFPLVLCPIVGIVALVLVRVRLSVDTDAPQNGGAATDRLLPALPFWEVLCMGLPAAVSTTIVLQLAPTHLSGMGFDLAFGGLATAMFGWGGVAGPFVWAAIAHRKGDLPASVWAFALSAPFMALYLVFIRHAAAVWLLAGVGFSSMAAYILTITLSRDATGLNLGQRMAFVVGGTWGIAMVVFLGLAVAADWVGTGPILKLTPAGYLLSGLLGVRVVRRHPEAAYRHRTARVLAAPGGEHVPA